MLASTYMHGLSELSPVTLFRLLKLLNLTPSRAFCHRWWIGAYFGNKGRILGTYFREISVRMYDI